MRAAVDSTGATGMAQMGQVMKVANAKAAGAADGIDHGVGHDEVGLDVGHDPSEMVGCSYWARVPWPRKPRRS